MIVEGRAVVIPGSDVDTDVMYPGEYLNIDDPEQMKPYLFEGFDPSLRDQLGDDAILVTGPNFGIGSSREHVPQAMKAWGVQAIVGPSFARIFRRNCVNLGLLVLEAPEAAAAAKPGCRMQVRQAVIRLTPVRRASSAVETNMGDCTCPPWCWVLNSMNFLKRPRCNWAWCREVI